VSKRRAFSGLVRFLYQTRFAAAQGTWVEGFLSLLVEMRRVFGNDLDKVIILSTIGQQMLLDGRIPKRNYDEWILDPLMERHGRVTNIDAIARATGIPRESVRRKVNELIAAQLVTRREGNDLAIAPGTAARMARSTEISVNMLDHVVSTYLAMMVDSDLIKAERLVHSPAGHGDDST
jgi:hypothetical protein